MRVDSLGSYAIATNSDSDACCSSTAASIRRERIIKIHDKGNVDGISFLLCLLANDEILFKGAASNGSI